MVFYRNCFIYNQLWSNIVYVIANVEKFHNQLNNKILSYLFIIIEMCQK
jgi:hypothetical protein